jgi:hypothetical protein
VGSPDANGCEAADASWEGVVSGENLRAVGEPVTAEEWQGVGKAISDAFDGSASGAAFESGGVGFGRERGSVRVRA